MAILSSPSYGLSFLICHILITLPRRGTTEGTTGLY